MMNDADDSSWMSVTDELGDEWIEDDTKGNMLWKAALQRDSTSDDAREDAPASLPRPRSSDDLRAVMARTHAP